MKFFKILMYVLIYMTYSNFTPTPVYATLKISDFSSGKKILDAISHHKKAKKPTKQPLQTQPAPVNPQPHILKNNINKDITVALGSIMIEGLPQTPKYQFGTVFLQLGLNQFISAPEKIARFNTVKYYNTPWGLKPGLFNSIYDTSFDNNNYEPVPDSNNPKLLTYNFKISPHIENLPFFTLLGSFAIGKSNTGDIVSRMLTVMNQKPSNQSSSDTGSLEGCPTNYESCYVEFDIQELLKKITLQQPTDYNIKFDYVLINLRFDSCGAYLSVDSADVYFTIFRDANDLKSQQVRYSHETFEENIYNGTCISE